MSGMPFAVLGDKTTGGGAIIQGSPNSDIDGKPIARVGDKATCPQKGHGGVSTIISGDATCIIDGKPAARHGDSLACGCKIIASQSLVTTGGPGGSGDSQASQKAAAMAADRAVKSQPYNEYFRVVDQQTGKPVTGFVYGILHNGAESGGSLMEGGRTSLAYSSNADPVDLDFLVQTQIGIRE